MSHFHTLNNVWARNFSLSQNVKTKSSAHLASCMAGVEGSVYRGKVAGTWGWSLASFCSMFFPLLLWHYANEHKNNKRVQEINNVKLVCRNTVELEIRQDATQQRGIRKYVGPLLVTIQELDGTFRHTLQVEGTVAKADITCHSKSRRNKKKKIPLCTGEEVDMDLGAMEWVTHV